VVVSRRVIRQLPSLLHDALNGCNEQLSITSPPRAPLATNQSCSCSVLGVPYGAKVSRDVEGEMVKKVSAPLERRGEMHKRSSVMT
jgi:hypothetical protein